MTDKEIREQIARQDESCARGDFDGKPCRKRKPDAPEWWCYKCKASTAMQSMLDELTAAREVVEAADAWHKWCGDNPGDLPIDMVPSALQVSDALANYKKVKGDE